MEETGWIAARSFECAGEAIRFAHTSPVYIEIARSFLKWIDREVDYYRRESRFRSEEDRAAMLSLFERARRIYERLSVP